MVERIEDLVRISGSPVEGADGSSLVFGFGQGGISRARFRTHPGMIWIASCSISLVTPGALLSCRFGAIFQDDAGEIVQWWNSPAMTFADGRPMRLRFEASSPEGATWVRLGMIGPRSDNEKSIATYKYAECQLKPLRQAAAHQE